MAKKCDICGNKLGMMNDYKIKDGNICLLCSRISQAYQTESLENMKRYWNINHERFSIFRETLKLKSLMSEIISIDDEHKLFMIGKLKNKNMEPIVYSFNEVVSYDNEVIGGKTITKKKGGIRRAVIGGAIAGPVGAMVGSGTATEESQVSGGTPVLKVNFVMVSGNYTQSISFPPNGFTEFLDKCILDDNCGIKRKPCNDNVADEIKKYKDLLDVGAITENEFEQLKKKLLNL